MNEIIKIGTVIANCKIYAMDQNCCIAESINESPEPFVVWQIDRDRTGVCSGSYFADKMDAEWEYCSRAFVWFQDNVNIEFDDDTKKSQDD